MLCSRCKQKPASVHFEGHINNQSLKLDLCESCAAQSGIPFASLDFKFPGFLQSMQFPSAPPLISQLFAALSQLPTAASPLPAPLACPKCRWTLRDFQSTGNMGCPDCYSHFRAEAKNILKQIHGTTAYAGAQTPFVPAKKMKTSSSPPAKESKASLQKQLERAVRDERYEDAAKLRDQIRGLDQK